MSSHRAQGETASESRESKELEPPSAASLVSGAFYLLKHQYHCIKVEESSSTS